MTPKELANKIVTRFMTFSNSTDCVSYAESLLSAALDEAELRGVDKCNVQWNQILPPQFELAKKDAYEQAAQVAEGVGRGTIHEHWEAACEAVATKIRALRDGMGK